MLPMRPTAGLQTARDKSIDYVYIWLSSSMALAVYLLQTNREHDREVEHFCIALYVYLEVDSSVKFITNAGLRLSNEQQ